MRVVVSFPEYGLPVHPATEVIDAEPTALTACAPQTGKARTDAIATMKRVVQKAIPMELLLLRRKTNGKDKSYPTAAAVPAPSAPARKLRRRSFPLVGRGGSESAPKWDRRASRG